MNRAPCRVQNSPTRWWLAVVRVAKSWCGSPWRTTGLGCQRGSASASLSCPSPPRTRVRGRALGCRYAAPSARSTEPSCPLRPRLPSSVLELAAADPAAMTAENWPTPVDLGNPAQAKHLWQSTERRFFHAAVGVFALAQTRRMRSARIWTGLLTTRPSRTSISDPCRQGIRQGLDDAEAGRILSQDLVDADEVARG